MNYLYWLSQIQDAEKSLVGNQLYVLSQLVQRDYEVLPGFVLSNSLLRQFLTESADFQALIEELSNSSFNFDDRDAFGLQSVARRSRQIIARSALPQAVEREIFQATLELNSNCAILQPFFSFPGGRDVENKGFWRSHTCKIHPQALSETIKAVWSELFTANSLIYRHKLGLGGQGIELHILVRPLKPVRASGVVEISPDLIRIKAVWGQAPSWLQGDVETDEYYLDRHTGRILSRILGLKNYGYRIKKFDSQTPLTDCLESYVPQEHQSKTYVLKDRAIAKLFQLTQDILQQQSRVEYICWTIPEIEDSSSPNFLITQLGENLATSINLKSRQTTPVVLSSDNTQSLLSGIPAAPGKAIGKVVIIENFDRKFESICADSILVIKELPPEHIAALARVKGIVIENGGKTSHGAIVARELNIPAIVNAVNATKILTNGVEIFLDGDTGTVYLATAAKKLPLPDSTKKHSAPNPQSIATKLMVNISQLQSISSCLNLPIDGVGLLRSELMLAQILKGSSPLLWQSKSFQAEFSNSLKESLRQFLVAFAPRPIFYRSLELTTRDGNSSILGNHGTYNYQLEPTLFSLELDALAALAREGHHNFNLILPFVRSLEEFRFCYRSIENAGLTERKSFQVWLMAEVPSVLWLLPEYIRAGVRGVAIGTNDLTQLLLGIDREQAHFERHGLNANHQVVRQAIAKLIAIARNNNIDCCICGQAPVDYPELINDLVEWGINAISVEPKAVEQTYDAIARAESKILLNSLRFQ